MVITELAEGTEARHLGELLGFFGVPAVGLIMLVVGLRRRSQSRSVPPPFTPYGHPPPGGPVAGYPNPYAPPPYPPPYPQPPYPVPPRKGSSGTALIVIGSIMLALGVLGFIGRATDVSSQSDKSARVGQCITQADFQNDDLTAPPRDCAEADAIFEVAAKGDAATNCPDGKLEGSAYSFLRKGDITMCFMLNLTQDQCYTVTGTADNPSFAPADCASSGPRIRVVKRDHHTFDHAMCPAGTKPISYPQPERLYCLERLAR